MRKILTFFMIIISVLIAGCADQKLSDCSPSIPTPQSDDLLEERLFELELLDDPISLHIGDEIHLLLRNTSDYSIWFPPGLDIFIIRRISEKSYENLDNLSAPVTEESLILTEAGTQNDTFEFSIQPNFMDFSERAEVGVYVNGYIFNQAEICKGRYYATITVDMFPQE